MMASGFWVWHRELGFLVGVWGMKFCGGLMISAGEVSKWVWFVFFAV